MWWIRLPLPPGGCRLGVVAVLLASLLVPLPAAHRSGQALAAAVEEIDARDAIRTIAEAVSNARTETATLISRLRPEFAAAIKDIQSLDGTQLFGFSSETIVETLYRRAETRMAGEGDRFLAILHDDLSKRSASLAGDPAFAALMRFSPQDLGRSFVFASLSAIADPAMRPPLTPAAERAIGKLAEVYTGRHMMQARGMILRNFRRPGFDVAKLNRVLAESRTSTEVLDKLVRIGLPPRPAGEAFRDMLREAMAHSAVHASDASLLKVMDDLSSELPPEYARYAQVEDTLGSRQEQMAQAASIGMPGKAEPPREAAILAHLGSEPPPPPLDPFFPPPPGGTPTGPGSGSPPLKGPPGLSLATVESHTRTYESYTRQTFQPIDVSMSGPATATPRTYSVAIRSASAARGVAIGGEFHSAIQSKPARAFWMPNAKDERFGRLVVEFIAQAGQPAAVAVSRVMFADSVHGAMSVLSGKHGKEAAYRKGNIVVLMSMDPDSEILRRPLLQLEGRQETLKRALARIKPGYTAERDKLINELFLLELQKDALPRGIIVHPGIVGRELAWSAARVDFWFNRIDDLSAEAAAMNGGRQMPPNLAAVEIQRAGTWQFYELASTIRLGAVEKGVPTLVVASKRPDAAVESARSHFAVSMFSLEDTAPPDSERVEPNVYRLPKLEASLQGMLDWLAVNHHDFMRLNDFSEAFSLLRWLEEAGAKVTLFALGGQAAAIATPDRIVIGEGPQVPKK